MNGTLPKQTVISRAVRLDHICNLTGASRATVWRWVKNDSSFPRRFRLSAGITCWDEGEILAWIETKKAARTQMAWDHNTRCTHMRGVGSAQTPTETADAPA
jgi:predicted DNA-binding transcriptional regulator AlpA